MSYSNKNNKFYLLSLGCAKNTVDSDSIAFRLQQDGFSLVERPSQAQILIVNTCGFIEAARQESLQELKKLSKKKKPDQILIAAGCLSERNRERIIAEVPAIDGIISTRRWLDMSRFIHALQEERASKQPRFHIPDSTDEQELNTPRIAIQGGSAYLKIADGCRRNCAFCSIPLIKGTAVSRPVESILSDVIRLQKSKVNEIVLIAQDTTDYGNDLGMKDGLSLLLKEIVKTTPDIPWIRLLYTYPGYISDELINVIAGNKQILHYLDLPLQHSHPDILKKMNRPFNIDWTYKTIAKLRREIPDIAFRTTFIVGYPGETNAEFNHLISFIQEINFDHVGAFTFSFEPGTASEQYGDPVSPDEKVDRLEQLMQIQEKISLTQNQKLVGKTLPVLIEGSDQGLSVGRSYRDAPEIDGLVIIENETPAGSIIPVQITGALAHDLTGRLIA